MKSKGGGECRHVTPTNSFLSPPQPADESSFTAEGEEEEEDAEDAGNVTDANREETWTGTWTGTCLGRPIGTAPYSP